MNKDELEKLVLKSKDSMKLATAFEAFDDKQRKELSAHAQSLFKQLEKNKATKSASDLLTKHIKARKGDQWNFWHTDDTVNSRLAVIALGPLSAVKSAHFYWRDDSWPTMNKIIVDRNPEWLDDWIEHDLAQEFPHIPFYRIWSWMKVGLCKQPVHDGFYVRFAQYMMATGFYDQGPGLPISKALNAEPELKDYVWSLFRVESDAFNTNSWFKKGAADDHETWTEALLKMSDAGDLDRQRLLDESLKGLWQDVKQNQLSGFHKFHKALKPTPEERSARQAGYLSLLSHSVGHVVKFGLDNAGVLEKTKELDAKVFLAEVPNVFFQDGKGNAVTAVKLMGRLLKNQPKTSGAVLATLPEALRHPHADVQKLALELLEKNEDKIDGSVREKISDAADFVSASIRKQLAPFLEKEIASAAPSPEIIETVDTSKFSTAKKTALRVGELNKDGPFDYWPISPNILDHEVVPGLEKLKPITDEDELISAISHAVEVVDSPDEIERIIDGISRLAGKRSEDFKEKVAALIHRIEKRDQTGTEKGLRTYGNANTAIMSLISAWIGSKHFSKKQISKFEQHVTVFIPTAAYIHEIVERVRSNIDRPLLPMPTHSGGWIDPIVWVERLKNFERDGVAPSEIEMSLSMLRLAPDNRGKALKKASGLKPLLGRVARFALGGEEAPKDHDKKEYGLWISAARCRNPYGNLSNLLAPLELNDDWPDSLTSASVEWNAFTKESKSDYSDEIFKYSRLALKFSTPTRSEKEKAGYLRGLKRSPTTKWERIPSAAPFCRTPQKYYWSSELNAPWITKWVFYQWPQNPNAANIIAVECLMGRIDEDSSGWEPNYGFLEGLFQKNRPWFESGHLHLCIALAGKDADVRGLAIDAMIEGIEKGLLDIDICAGVLVKLSEGGWLKLNRLGDNLMTVSETSNLHAWVVSDLIQKWIQKTDLKQRFIFRMFEVLLEALSILELSPAAETKTALQTIKGSSKAAKTAKALIGMKSVENPNLDTELKNLAISGRV